MTTKRTLPPLCITWQDPPLPPGEQGKYVLVLVALESNPNRWARVLEEVDYPTVLSTKSAMRAAYKRRKMAGLLQFACQRPRAGEQPPFGSCDLYVRLVMEPAKVVEEALK